MSVEAAIANYQTGKVPFVAVLEALTTLYSDRATHLRVSWPTTRASRASLEEASLEATSEHGAGGRAGDRRGAAAALGAMARRHGRRLRGAMRIRKRA